MKYELAPRSAIFEQYSPMQYGLFLQESHHIQVANLQQTFAPLNKLSDSCIVIVGSDGKGERNSQSKTEFTHIESCPTGSGCATVSDFFINELRFSSDDMGMNGQKDALFDQKDMNSGELLSYAYHSTSNIYPDRILNSTFIAGNQDIFHEARTRILEEIGGEENFSVDIRRVMGDQLRKHKRAIVTGNYSHQQLFDREEGVQFYSEEKKSLNFGFKPAFLRTVQRKLDLITAKAVLSKKLNPHEAALIMPSFTPFRIQFLEEAGILPADISNSLVPAYLWFLQQYHNVQQQYKSTREHIGVSFCTDQFKVHEGTIIEFGNLPT